MLKTLLKKQMAEIFRNYFYDPKKNKMRSRGATIAYIALYALLMVGLLGGMFALLAVGICAPMAAAGVGWLYYLVMGLIAVLLGAFGSVFSTYSSLYLSKDNDLLLSMPIPVRYVMASRLLGVYLLGLMYSGVATVPAVIVYWIVAPVTAGTVVGGVLTVLLVSVIVMVLSPLLFHEQLTHAKLLGFAAVFAAVLLHETMQPLQILGAVLILCGAAGAECVPMLLQRRQKC